MDYVYYPDYLEHHGILGQKWGVRRYQNEDGSYTEAGLKRRKGINTALAVAGGIGVNVGVTLGSGNPIAGRLAGGLTAATIKSSLDSRAESRKNKKKLDDGPNALDDYYNSDAGKAELKNYSKQNTIEKTKAVRDKAYNNLVKDITAEINNTNDTNARSSLIWVTDSDKPKVIADKLIKAQKNLNEYIDPDCEIFQRMPEEAMEGYSRGYLSKKQFDNIYDKHVIDTVSEYSLPEINGISDMMKDALKVNVRDNENRFTSWFGNGPENPEALTHYFYSSDSIYL